jgi:hypothetical protein
MKPKIVLVTFYTEGPPLDNAKDLSTTAKNINEKYQSLYDYTFILSPSILKKLDEGWNDIIYDKDFAARHLRSEQRKDSINIPWINLNSQLWKPAILSALMAHDSGIEEGTIIVYHDVDTQKYPIYNANFNDAGAFFRNRLSNHSIALVSDDLFYLYKGCKQEVLRKYLHIEGRTLCHRWAGSFAMKKNKHSRKFCRDWYNLTARYENRSQITSFDKYPGFIWHCPEQSTLSVVYYLWKYGSTKGRHIKTVFAPGREVAIRWSLIRGFKFFLFSAKFHSRYFCVVGSIVERLVIAIKARLSLKYLDDYASKIPNIKIDCLLQ